MTGRFLWLFDITNLLKSFPRLTQAAATPKPFGARFEESESDVTGTQSAVDRTRKFELDAAGPRVRSTRQISSGLVVAILSWADKTSRHRTILRSVQQLITMLQS